MNILYNRPQDTNQFSKLFLDYICNSPSLVNFIRDFPSADSILRELKNFKFDYLDRNLLADELTQQYQAIRPGDKVRKNIESLRSENTFTITTGHQLCLFTGPSYFIYKIISCIKMCDELKRKMPEKNFVPVYWMATEDHDLEEIDHANFFGKKIHWNINGKGRAGELPLEGMKECIQELQQILGSSAHTGKIITLFNSALEHSKNLAEFTRYVVNEIFADYGLLIVDGNSQRLKKLFVKEMVQDVTEHTAYAEVIKTSEKLKNSVYEIQVNPREINLFYVEKNLRERIEQKGDEYIVLNTEIKFTREELLKKIEFSPESFSPNVVLRPLFQQKILPNIIYCGGPGEISYWLEYKSFFDKASIHFPFLVPRNFNVMLSESNFGKWKELGFDEKDFFKPENELINQVVKRSSGEISFVKEKEELEKLFIPILSTVEKTDKTLTAFAAAEKQKVMNAISAIESKLNKALRQKNETAINQVKNLRAKVLPDGVLQERSENFFAFTSGYGLTLIDDLAKGLPSPLEEPVVALTITS